MSGKYKLVKDQIENLLVYLQPFLPLANCHMVDYFSKDVYRKNIPIDIQKEIQYFGEETVTNFMLNNNYTKLPNLLKYIEKSQEFTLKNNPDICTGLKEFQDKLQEWGCDELLRLKLEIFMTSKKSHEVDILSFVAAAVRNVAGTSHVIDIGDGKGYLSSMLALHHKIPVLGVDASAINTDGALKRLQKLSRVWNSVANVDNKKSKETTVNLYRQITQFVDEHIDFKDLVSKVFLETPTGLSLVGLHTCGNLAASSIKIFNSNDDIRTICNVGCCYHQITEMYENNTKTNGISDYGFPMSRHLQSIKFALGRSARMIAAQSVDRIWAKKDLPNKSIFYRALFEVLLERKCGSMSSELRQVGRFRKESENFHDYVQKAAERINLEVDISDKEIDDLYREYESRIHELNVFYLIRSLLAPVIESLILLDRLLYLYEEGWENAFLVQCFDPVVSPRCYGLVALK